MSPYRRWAAVLTVLPSDGRDTGAPAPQQPARRAISLSGAAAADAGVIRHGGGSPGSPRAAGPAGTASALRPLPASRPDIVLLIVDDLAEMDLRVWNRLPTIRRLFLDQGIRFTDAFSNDPLCCPGRAALLTGQRTPHHGVLVNDARAFDPRVSLGTELSALGYHTVYAGKYFNRTERLAQRHPPGWDHALVYSGGYWRVPLWKDGVAIRADGEEGSYTTDIIRRTAVGWLRQAPPDPLLLVLSPYAVHSGLTAEGRQLGYEMPAPAPRHRGDPRCAGIPPWRPPAYNEADRSDKPAWLQASPRTPYRDGWPLGLVCETLLSVDAMLAAVERTLIEQGRRDVLYVLVGDNGMAFGDHGWAKKRVPYATRLPLLMHWAAGLGTAPRRIRSTVSNIDIAPTLCEIAGCTMGPFPDGDPVDGLSLVPLLDGSVDRLPRDVLIEEHHTTYTNPRWVGVRTTRGSPLGSWVYTRYETGAEELYDLAGDPAQLENRARDPAFAAKKAQLVAALEEAQHPAPRGGSTIGLRPASRVRAAR
jgi:arylsulfatase A-like enzyme